MSTKQTFPKEGQKILLTTNPQNSTAQVRRRVTIAGQVVNALTQRPISGATVQLNQPVPGNVPIAISTSLTGADGWFYFLGVPPGNYKLEASLPGAGTRFGKHLASFNQIKNRLNQLNPDNHVDSVRVQLNNGEYIRKGQPVTFYRTRLNLVPTTIAGRVNDSGEGVKFAKVQLMGRGEPALTFSSNDDAVNPSSDALALYLLQTQFENPQAAGKNKIGFYILSELETFKTSPRMPLKYSVVAPNYSGRVARDLSNLVFKGFSLEPGEVKIINFQFEPKSNS